MKQPIPTICLVAILSAGCSTGATPEPELNICNDPRPEICTQEYNPVCATLDDGSKKTYSTGCSACSDAQVNGWLPGECG